MLKFRLDATRSNVGNKWHRSTLGEQYENFLAYGRKLGSTWHPACAGLRGTSPRGKKIRERTGPPSAEGKSTNQDCQIRTIRYPGLRVRARSRNRGKQSRGSRRRRVFAGMNLNAVKHKKWKKNGGWVEKRERSALQDSKKIATLPVTRTAPNNARPDGSATSCKATGMPPLTGTHPLCDKVWGTPDQTRWLITQLAVQRSDS